MDLWDALLKKVLVFFWAFVFVASLVAMFSVAMDLFRDKELSGWWKALWLVFLVFLPLLTALVYLVARGKGMSERSAREYSETRRATEEYIRSVASSGPAEEIGRAKALLDAGTISRAEFESLKERALAGRAA